jgi:hypothetical protein
VYLPVKYETRNISERSKLAGPYLPRNSGPSVSRHPARMNTGGSIKAHRMLYMKGAWKNDPPVAGTLVHSTA